MGLKDLFKRGGGMKDPVRGTAQVVSATMHHGRGIYQNCQMQLVVQADGVPATAISFSGLVHRKRWPSPGMVLPVTVDRADARNVKIEWDEGQRSDERSRQSAETLAAMMRGEPAGPGSGVGGMPTVLNLSGRDLSQLSEEQKAKLQMLGFDPEALAAQQGAAAAAGVPPAPSAEEPVDEDIDRLERLARLKEQGVLNDEEFRTQKRRILEE